MIGEHSPQQADEFVNKLFQIRWLSKKHLAEELTIYQLTPAQYAALKLLCDEPQGMKMSSLAAQAHQVSATMTGIIDRLEYQGLVERKRQNADRRNVYVHLTEKGEFLLLEIKNAMRSRFQEILNRLDANQKNLLFDTIDIVIDYFTEHLRGTL
jgi:DNA-binding MarR family transcriptional regulator